MTLVIMAAGMGSRFGGLKQMEPVGPNGEFIIDYSIYDAKRLGFKKIVFIIRKDFYENFKNTIGKRLEGTIEVEYVFQELDNVPSGITIPQNRVKPLGTGHALMCLKGVVNEPFVIINADDFYGYEAYLKILEFAKENTDKYGLVVYNAINTLTKNGKVKRGLCKVKDGYVSELIECSMEEVDGVIKAETIDGKTELTLPLDALVSMNLFYLQPDIIDYLCEDIKEFLKNSNLETCEYILTSVLLDRINKENLRIKVINTDSVWHGVTYKEDKQELVDSINKLIEKGEYPKNLYT